MTTPAHTPRVLIFDSGVGSLSIGAEIHRRLPGIDLLYVMDRDGFPYGSWQPEALVAHICDTLEKLLQQHAADLVVVACNSASTAVLPALRARISAPVVGVVPAIKPAAALSRSRVIGLLATPGTIARPYTRQLIDDFAADCTVIPLGSALLAPAAEAQFHSGVSADATCQQVMAELLARPRATEIDTIVLACTHFPLLQAQLAAQGAALAPEVTWVDSGEAIARRVETLLGEIGARDRGNTGDQQALLLTAAPASAHFVEQLNKRGIALLRAEQPDPSLPVD